MESLYKQYQQIRNFLLKEGIDSILYGSLGASLYLGEFKQFGDIDLLIPEVWMNDKWEDLVKIMEDQGFKLVDLKEHEFENSEGMKVAFASKNVLVEDEICDPDKDPVILKMNDIDFRTLKVSDFLKAYQFSAQDGYRKDKRGKNDQEAIIKLKEYIDNQISNS